MSYHDVLASTIRVGDYINDPETGYAGLVLAVNPCPEEGDIEFQIEYDDPTALMLYHLPDTFLQVWR